MTATQGLHIRKDGAVGTTPVDARLAMAGLVAATGAFGGRPGVLSGCVVSGTTGWAYSVAAGHLVTSRSAGDGVVLWSVSSATSVPTSAAPASGSRIDIIYAMHHDLDNGDGDNLPVLDVVQGTAAADPSVPSIPAGAIELGRCTLPSGATTTQGGTFSAGSVQHTAARGAPIPVTGQAQQDAITWGSSTNPARIHRLDSHKDLINYGSGWKVVSPDTWAGYVPIQTNFSTGGGSITARYCRNGDTVHVRGLITFGSTVSITGTIRLSLPVAPASTALDSRVALGTALFYDFSAGPRIPGAVTRFDGQDQFFFRAPDGGAVNATTPFSFAVDDAIGFSFSYEAA